MDRCDVAIVGAGPYGLCAAAHLRRIKGLDIRLFGEPMSFWERHMPEHMLLRSPWAASSIADPDAQLSLDVYRDDTRHRSAGDPVPAADFIRYGRWMLGQMALTAEGKVVRVDPAPNGYQLAIEGGDALMARRVVVAGGIQPFAYRPEDVPRPSGCARHPHVRAARLRRGSRTRTCSSSAPARARSSRRASCARRARAWRCSIRNARRALAREEAAVAAREGDPLDVLRPRRHRAGRRQPLRPAPEPVPPAAAPPAGLVGTASDSARRVRPAHGQHRRGDSARTISGDCARRRRPRSRPSERRVGSSSWIMSRSERAIGSTWRAIRSSRRQSWSASSGSNGYPVLDAGLETLARRRCTSSARPRRAASVR